MDGKKTPWNDISSIWKKIAAVISAVGVLATLTVTLFNTPVGITYAIFTFLGLILLLISWYVDKQAKYSHDELVSHTNNASKIFSKAIDETKALAIKIGENSENRLNRFEKRVDELIEITEDTRKDTLRIQLLMLMSNEENNVDTILKVAELYFIGLHGDWYMTSEFCKWAKKHDVVIPDGIWSVMKEHSDFEA